MAHLRKRHIEDLFNHLLKFSPIVGVFGHRQVGKSTFIASNVSEYKTLDDVDALHQAHTDPKAFITTPKRPFAIDECQLEPKLFPTLKEWVRTRKQPGQFVLSGSVRFTSRKAIRESLAGRLVFIEMHPLSVSELAQKPLSDVIPRLLRHKEFSEDSMSILKTQKDIPTWKRQFEVYLENGGLPGLCFIRENELRRRALFDLHDLILTRDLELVADIRINLPTIKKWLSYVTKLGFSPYNASEVKRILGLAPQTQKKLLHALESIFLIQRIAVPERKKEIILLEDQMEEFVYGGATQEPIKRLETAVFRNIRTQFAYRLSNEIVYESYLTRDNARVAIVIREQATTLGLIVTTGEHPTLSEVRSANSFLRKFSGAKVLFLSSHVTKPKLLDSRSALASIYAVL